MGDMSLVLKVMVDDLETMTREILNQAILENDFMKNLDTSQVVEIVECMYSVKFAPNSTIIREGELGSVVYVMEVSSPLSEI
ncbi:hypothetical protein ACTXT7_001982 [Hymenolepis weldensis]